MIRSWNTAGWFDWPQRIGDKIGRLIGAGPGEAVATDSTSVNLFKVLSLAMTLQHQQSAQRRSIISERSNFPTDLYIAEALCRQQGWTLKLIDADELPQSLNAETGILMLTHVNYRSGAMHDMAALTAAAHTAGALAVWDLAHSAGAVPLDLNAANADFAVGCGYKYLNGGPGAPAFAWLHPRHAAALGRDIWQPLAGWWGHAAPFAFTPDYQPAPGIGRFLCGTQPIISLTRQQGAYAIVQALIARGVIGDFRAGDTRQPDILRFGFTPLYLSHTDVWYAVEHLRQVLDSGEWQKAEYQGHNAVT